MLFRSNFINNEDAILVLLRKGKIRTPTENNNNPFGKYTTSVKIDWFNEKQKNKNQLDRVLNINTVLTNDMPIGR